MTGRSLADLTPEHRAAVLSRLAARTNSGTGIEARPDLPDVLSPGQTRLWRMLRDEPAGDLAYAMGSAHLVKGALDVPALAAAIDAIVADHDQLRARFDDTGPHIGPCPEGLLEVQAAPDLETALAAARAEAETLDPRIGRVFLPRLWVVGGERALLTLVAHHLVCDGRSLAIIESELSRRYNGQGTVAPPALRYSDWARWKAEHAPDDATVDRWRAALAGATALRLPISDPHGADDTHGPMHFEVGGRQSDAVRARARDSRSTPFAVMLAAFALALRRMTGLEDLLICTPEEGRTHSATEAMVGYFNDVTVLRIIAERSTTAREMVTVVQREVGRALDHPMPFHVVATLPETRTVRLTNVLFGLDERAGPGIWFDGSTTERVSLSLGGSDFRVGWFMGTGPGGFTGAVHFDPLTVGAADVARMIDAFLETLDAILSRPDEPLDNLDHVTPDSPRSDSRDRRPTSLLEAQVQSIWSRIFDRPVGRHDDFFELGGHSMLAAELMDTLERDLGVGRLPLAELFRSPTVSALAVSIEAAGWTASWSSLVPIAPMGHRVPLFFVHAHGGNVIGFRDLAAAVHPDRPFYGLQTPDMDRPAAISHDIRDIADLYVAEIRSVQPTGPYLLGGHCLGGGIAYEMAQRLTASGEHVAAVVMTDLPRPGAATAPPETAVGRLSERLIDRCRLEWSNLRVAGHPARHVLGRLEGARRVATLFFEGKMIRPDGSLPLGLAHSRAWRVAAIGRVHEKAYDEYVPGPWDGAVVLVRAATQKRRLQGDPTLGWSDLVADVRVYEVAGTRLGMLDPPRVGDVARHIEDAIASVLGEDR
jgi:thioesterase domain-containing protein